MFVQKNLVSVFDNVNRNLPEVNQKYFKILFTFKIWYEWYFPWRKQRTLLEIKENNFIRLFWIFSSLQLDISWTPLIIKTSNQCSKTENVQIKFYKCVTSLIPSSITFISFILDKHSRWNPTLLYIANWALAVDIGFCVQRLEVRLGYVT